jgi:hypothetical protein
MHQPYSIPDDALISEILGTLIEHPAYGPGNYLVQPLEDGLGVKRRNRRVQPDDLADGDVRDVRINVDGNGEIGGVARDGDGFRAFSLPVTRA